MIPFKRRDSYFINKEQLGEEIANLQELVQDMKDGFAGAMQELARIQSGDQVMRATIDKTRTDCEKDIVNVKGNIAQLKHEIDRTVEDCKTYRRAVEELKAEVTILKESVGEQRNQLQSSVCPNHNENSLPPNSSKKSNVDSYNAITSLPRVSPMLQTFIASLSNSKSHTKQSDGEFSLEDISQQIEVSESSSVITYNSKKTLSTISDVNEIFNPDRTDRKDQRLQLAKELLESESQYQADLGFLIEKVRERLLQSTFISSNDVLVIFPTILSSIREKHYEVLKVIDKRIRNWEQHSTLGDIYARIAGHNEKLLEKYRQYIRGFSTCVSTFNHHLKSSPEFTLLIRETIVSHYPDYSNPNRIMFAPLHRIPYYVQHIKRIQNCTDENSPDQYHLASSLRQLKQIVKKINLLVKRTKTEENTTGSHSPSELLPQSNSLKGGHNDLNNTVVTPPEIVWKAENVDKSNTSLREEGNNSLTEKHSEPSSQKPKSGLIAEENVTSKKAGRRRSLSTYMLEIPEETIDTRLLGCSLPQSLLEHLRLEDSQEAVEESSDDDSQEGDGESCTAMSSKEGDGSHDAISSHGDDLSQEELELIGKPQVKKKDYLAFEDGCSPQRAPSFGVYGDLDWKGEGGEYVPSAIEMNFPPKQSRSQTLWRNIAANQQSEKTESEYHTSDEEPIPINSPLYDIPVSAQPCRELEKRRGSSLGELMIIPPQQKDDSLFIQWETMNTTSDENTEDDGLLSNGKNTEEVFKAVSHQRKMFGMRRRRSIDGSDPSMRDPMRGTRVSVSTPRESWTEDENGLSKHCSPQTIGDKIKHPLKNALKRITVNNDKTLRSDDVTKHPPDVMRQFAEIAQMIVESTGSPTKAKNPCSDV